MQGDGEENCVCLYVCVRQSATCTRMLSNHWKRLMLIPKTLSCVYVCKRDRGENTENLIRTLMYVCGCADKLNKLLVFSAVRLMV